MNEATNLMETVAEKTHSELVLAFVVFCALILGIIILLGIMIISYTREKNKSKTETLQKDNEREEHILEVIKGNTQVLAELKSMLETSGQSTSQSFARLHERIDQIFENTEEIKISLCSKDKEVLKQ